MTRDYLYNPNNEIKFIYKPHIAQPDLVWLNYKNNDYLWNYFGPFLNEDNYLYKAHKPDIDITPDIFEAGSILGLDSNSDALTQILVAIGTTSLSELKPEQFSLLLNNLPPEVNYPNELSEVLLATGEQYGWDRIPYPVNQNHQVLRTERLKRINDFINFLKYQLKEYSKARSDPGNFIHTYGRDKYDEITRLIYIHLDEILPLVYPNKPLVKMMTTFFRHYGWIKDDIFDIIKKSGFIIDKNNVPIDQQKPKFKNYIKFGLNYVPIRGFDISYMPKIYYEAIYRWLFKTKTTPINWEKLCDLKIFNRKILNKIAVEQYQVDSYRIDELLDFELCNEIKNKEKERKERAKQIISEAQKIGPEIIYQPGAYWTHPQYATTMKQLPQFAPSVNPREMEREILSLCNNPNTSIFELIRKAHELDLLLYI